MTTTTPCGFLSYAHSDNHRDNDRIVEFSKKLSAEVKVQTGDSFEIFVDKHDIGWGQNWQRRINDSLNAVTFLLPILTPSYFKSQPCREELEQFEQRQAQLNRDDLILPFYYVGYQPLDDSRQHASDPMLQTIARHQWADWRHFRFEPLDSTPVLKALEQLALQIRDALSRSGTP